jgi:hypothetical protein
LTRSQANVCSTILSLPPVKRIDQLWADEAEDRLNAYENGEIKAVPASEVFKKINSKRK